MRKKIKIKTFQNALRNRKDSFWYEGDIALLTYKDREILIMACGDIRLNNKNGELVHDNSKWRGNGFPEFKNRTPKTDKDLRKLTNLGYTWENNNWFEPLYKKKDWGSWECLLGVVEYDYDKAIKMGKELLPKLKMIDDFKIIFGNIKGNDALGLYINGSYAWKPIFVLDLINLRNACSKYGSFISSAIETTILHEIGHAIQDSLGLEDIMWTDEAEDEAEEFAYQYYTFGKIMPIKERSLYA